MILNNFKSYYGEVVVDVNELFVWLVIISSFYSSVVGKNGSGKSAFMDALCWVFGFRSQSIRSENVNQLLNDQARKEGINEMYSWSKSLSFLGRSKLNFISMVYRFQNQSVHSTYHLHRRSSQSDVVFIGLH